MEEFRIVKSQYDEYSVERLNRNTPRKWVPCGDLRNPIAPLAGSAFYLMKEENRKIYDSYEEAAQAIEGHNKKREWTVVHGGVEMEMGRKRQNAEWEQVWRSPF